jgi:glyoxylase-like metal-dependent hydrolase (beta-lactamase superfamily II)
MQESTSRLPRLRRWLVAGLTVLILFSVVVAGYRWQTGKKEEPPAASRPHILGPYPVTIVPGIHLLGGLAPAAAYVVETSDGLVLIDTGLHADLVKRQMALLKLDWRRVCAIFLTHVHGDHCGGAQELRAATGAKVYAGKGDAAILRAGRPREAFFSTFPMPDPTPAPTTVDVELSGDQTITIGDVRFTALATPGHTPGSVCYRMERGERSALFSGDIIWALSKEYNPLGTYAALLAPRYRGDAETFLATLRRLRAMAAPQLVLPGHPRNDPVPQSPAMTQQRWEALLDPGIHEMEKVVQRHARDGMDFLDGTPKALLPDLYYLGDFKGVAVYGFFVSSKFFLVHAPGGPGLSDFVNASLEKLGRKPATPTAVLLTSADAEETAGLRELIEKYHPQIVVPTAGWETIKKTCPTETSILSPEDLPKKGWFAVTPIPLQGRGVTPIAYLLPWAKKAVLLTGRIPIKANRASVEALSTDMAQKRGNASEYRDSILRLSKWKPDLWLPASPIDGQNANLYDNAWQNLLRDNSQLIR